MATLKEHAAVIEAAIRAAFEDGYEIDVNGSAEPPNRMELNDYNLEGFGSIQSVRIEVPGA